MVVEGTGNDATTPATVKNVSFNTYLQSRNARNVTGVWEFFNIPRTVHAMHLLHSTRFQSNVIVHTFRLPKLKMASVAITFQDTGEQKPDSTSLVTETVDPTAKVNEIQHGNYLCGWNAGSSFYCCAISFKRRWCLNSRPMMRTIAETHLLWMKLKRMAIMQNR